MIQSEARDHPRVASHVSGTGSLLEVEEQWESLETEHQRRLALLNVLAQACEELGPTCIKNAQQTLLFVKVNH